MAQARRVRRGVALDAASIAHYTVAMTIELRMLAHAAGIHSSRTELGAQLYFWGRIAFVPMLVLGVPLVRSLVWNVASIGMLLVWSALVIR